MFHKPHSNRSGIVRSYLRVLLIVVLAFTIQGIVISSSSALTLSRLAVTEVAASDSDPDLSTIWWSDDRGGQTLAWGDADDDGDLDLAVGHNGRNHLYENVDGQLWSTAIWSSSDSFDTRSLAWGDVDANGYLDLVAGNYDGADVIYLNNGIDETGQISLSIGWTADTSERTRHVALGDWDGDGKLELAIGGDDGAKVLPHRGATLYTTSAWSITDPVSSLVWGDMNLDEKLDMTVAISRATCPPDEDIDSSSVRVYTNVGGNLAQQPAWSSGAITEPSSLAVGDIDADGDLDLVVGLLGCSYIENSRIWLIGGGVLRYDNQGNGTTVELNLYEEGDLPDSSTSILTVTSVALGDWRRDGELDLAYGTSYSCGYDRFCEDEIPGDVVIHGYWSSQDVAQYGNSSWSSGEATNTSSIAWVDVDGDGSLELSSAHMRINTNLGLQSGPTKLYKGNANRLTFFDWLVNVPEDYHKDMAWGDLEGDGDFDLVVVGRIYGTDYGNDSDDYGSRVFYNAYNTNDEYNRLVMHDWLPYDDESGDLPSIALGDMDGDGDLDAGVGTSVFPNEQGVLTSAPVWTASDPGQPTDTAWGDVEGDGDLDLIIGFQDAPLRLYLNSAGMLEQLASWTSTDLMGGTREVAWKDIDHDGDLDLAVAVEGAGARLYRNEGGTLHRQRAWDSGQSGTASVAWGDYDGDGWVDLAVGSTNPMWASVTIFRNSKGNLDRTPTWNSLDQYSTDKLVWADFDSDGDQDLTAAGDHVIRIYVNDDGRLRLGDQYSIPNAGSLEALAWGDFTGDGNLELAAGGEHDSAFSGPLAKLLRITNIRSYPDAIGYNVYRPSTYLSIIPFSDSIPTFIGNLTSVLAPADYYALAAIRQTDVIPFNYRINDPSAARTYNIRAYYSLGGGGYWLPAEPDAGTATKNIPANVQHTFRWDLFASGVFGQSDNVVFRLEASPSAEVLPNSAPGPYTWPYLPAQTYPFRVRGTQVRVLDQAGNPVPQALIYRLRRDQGGEAEAIGSATELYRTDSQGYLQGQGRLGVGDSLVALAPISSGNGYTLYHTSAAPTEQGLTFFTVSEAGVQTLTTSPNRKLLLFDLDVALEWDASKDDRYMAQLDFDLKRTSELLFDWSDGQMALGKVRVFHDARRIPEDGDGFQPWLDAHVRVLATNHLRPWAAQGGIVSESLTDPQHSEIVYEPGQVHMGAVWNRYGEAGGSLGEDWPRTLAHEFGHYLLYLDDNYMGLDADGVLVPIDTCPGAMADPYRDDYGEFHPNRGWEDECSETLSHIETGRSDWATIRRFYDGLTMPTSFNAQPGPRSLPLAVTQVENVEPADASDVLGVSLFYLTDAGGASTQAGNSARAFLLQGEWLTNVGRPTVGDVNARGARLGDRLCVLEPERARQGCETITAGDDQLSLIPVADWEPEIRVSPVTSTTVNISVNTDVSGLTLGARLYPTDSPAPTGIPLTADAGGYGGTFHLPEPALEGHVHIFDAYAVRLEAEEGQVSAPMLLGDNPDACSAGYVFSPEHFSTNAGVDFTIDVPTTGDYYLWARAMGIDHGQNSFFVSIDGGELAPFHIIPDQDTSPWPWIWEAYDTDQSSLPLDPIYLTQGQHTIRFAGRERNTRLDAIFLTDRPDFVPPDDAPCPNLPPATAQASNGREAITDYTIGGNPGHVRSGGGHVRSGGGHVRSGGAPAMSSDGQVIIFGRDLQFAQGEFYVVQAATHLPDPPSWGTVIGQGYWLTASANAPNLLSASISFQYLGSQVPPGEETFIKIYYWDGETWERIEDTNLNTKYNIASTRSRGPGLYALMSSIAIPLDGPGWNIFAYPVQEQRTVQHALRSIENYYTIVYGYDGILDEWRVYDPTAPDYANDLEFLEHGKGYWLHALEEIVLLLKGATGDSVSATTTIGYPPATFYGIVTGDENFTPLPGMSVRAWVNGALCGNSEIRDVDGQVVFSIKVDALNPLSGQVDDCGIPGAEITFEVEGQTAFATYEWDNTRAWPVNLQMTTPVLPFNLYLPSLIR